MRANRGWVMAPMQPVFRMKNSSSDRTDRVLVVTPTAPSVAQAYRPHDLGAVLGVDQDLVPVGDPPVGQAGRHPRTSSQNWA